MLVLLGDTRQDVFQTLCGLMNASKLMGLSVNQEKIKYMFLSRKTKNEENMKDLKVDSLTFQQVSSFKYLGVHVNSANCMHEKIKLRLKSANKAYFAMVSLFKSKLLSRKTKEKLYAIYLRPIATYGCNTWATTERNYNKLLVFERKMYGPIFDVNEQKWLSRSNEELKNLYSKDNIVQFVRSSRLAWAGHAWRADGSLITVIVNQIDQKRPRGRPRQRWLDVVRKDIEELKSDWNGNLDLAYARQVWGKLVLEAKSLNGL